MFVPAGTPEDISKTLNTALVEVLQEEAVKARLAEMGALPAGSSPAEFAEFLRKEDAKWGEVVRNGNIQQD